MVNGNRNVRSKWTAFAAVLLMAAAAFGAAAAVAEANDSDASVITESKVYALQRGEVATVMGIYDSGTLGDYTYSLPKGFSVTGTNQSKVHITCDQTVADGSYTVMMKRTVNGTEYSRSHTICVNSDYTSSGGADADYYRGTVGKLMDIAVRAGDPDYPIYVAGATLDEGRLAPGMSMSHDDYDLTVSGTPTAAGLYVAKITVSVTSDDGDGVDQRVIIMDVKAALAVPDQSVAAGGSVSISTGVPGITVTGQDWLHVSSDGRIYGTAPSAPGPYKATAHYGGQSDEFTITVVSALTFVSTPSAGAFAYEG